MLRLMNPLLFIKLRMAALRKAFAMGQVYTTKLLSVEYERSLKVNIKHHRQKMRLLRNSYRKEAEEAEADHEYKIKQIKHKQKKEIKDVEKENINYGRRLSGLENRLLKKELILDNLIQETEKHFGGIQYTEQQQSEFYADFLKICARGASGIDKVTAKSDEFSTFREKAISNIRRLTV